MHGTSPSTLDTPDLGRRLGELAGDEREVQIDFLLHLDEFDRRLAFREAGFPSLWEFCLKVLHLREGAAGRRIGAMRVLRRFPRLEAPLRDGRLCLSTVTLVGTILADENLDEVVARAAYRTKAEVEHLVASVRPRSAPKEGIRKLPRSPVPAAAVASTADEPEASQRDTEAPAPPAPSAPAEAVLLTLVSSTDFPSPKSLPPPARRAVEMTPVSADRYSLRATIDANTKEDLDTLAALLSHKIPDGDLAAVLREAIRCGVEKHGKRKGAVAPDRAHRTAPTRADRQTSQDPRAISAETRRAVWNRDGGRCTFVSADGHRCESRWQLELDHVRSPHHGGTAKPEDLRLRCRSHNLWYAERVFGREHMSRFCRTAEGPG